MAKKKNAKKKATAVSPAPIALGVEVRSSYVELRTMLDALEMGSLRYFLSGENEVEREKRAKKLIGWLRPVLDKIQKREQEQQEAGVAAMTRGDLPTAQGQCPDGYFECNGCCVPYPCP